MTYLGDAISTNIRWYKPNDPYYWEVDNLPIEDLQDNCIKLQNQLNNIPPLASFITEAEAKNIFLDAVTYEGRRLGDMASVDLTSTVPDQNYILNIPNTDQMWRASDKYTFFPTLKGVPGVSPDFQDVSISGGPANYPPQVLKWRSGVGGGQWVDEWDKNYDELLKHIDSEVQGTQGEHEFVMWDSTESKWTNRDLHPKCSSFNNPKHLGLLSFDSNVDRFTNRDPEEFTYAYLPDTSAYQNIPGQSGFFNASKYGDLLNLFYAKDLIDTSMQRTQYGNTWWQDTFGFGVDGNDDLVAGPDQWDRVGAAGTARNWGIHSGRPPGFNMSNYPEWLQHMNRNQQGTEWYNWRAVNDDLSQEVIVLESHDQHPVGTPWGKQYKEIPEGTTHLEGWIWQRLPSELAGWKDTLTGAWYRHPYEESWRDAQATNGDEDPSLLPKSNIGFFTGHKNDPHRTLGLFVSDAAFGVAPRLIPNQSQEVQVAIPIDRRGWWRDADQQYVYDGKHRVYIDMQKYCVANHETNFTQWDPVPVFLKIFITGWIT